MRKYIFGIVIGVLFLSAVIVLAGNLEPPSGPTDPTSQMYTLEQIHDRLSAGSWVTKTTSFTEPSSGPGMTGRTQDEVMDVAKPGALAPRVNKTGQTECWDSDGGSISCDGTGQDGEYEMGVDPVIEPTGGTEGAYNTPAWTGVRFTDNGDGTVTDNLTALIWLKNAGCIGLKTWAEALTSSNALADGDCGLTDGSIIGAWRLPNVNELHSLIDLTEYNPALPSGHHFYGVQNRHWSSTSSSPFAAWYMYLSTGFVGFGNKMSTNTNFVWPVRGGQ